MVCKGFSPYKEARRKGNKIEFTQVKRKEVHFMHFGEMGKVTGWSSLSHKGAWTQFPNNMMGENEILKT